jgi:hypothetical protein
MRASAQGQDSPKRRTGRLLALPALGVLPRTPYGNPAGLLSVIRIAGSDPASWVRFKVALKGLAHYAPEDLERRRVASHFPAGAVTLDGVDATEDGRISLTETLEDVPREPDAVTWLPGPFGRSQVATANEGDLFGGSRGFYDPEGIAIAPDDTLWIASEGNATDTRPNLLLQVGFDGEVMKEVGLPADYDLRPRLARTRGWITDKPEGVAVTWDGRTFVVTDNDGVEDWSGESWFLELGDLWRLFR